MSELKKPIQSITLVEYETGEFSKRVSYLTGEIKEEKIEAVEFEVLKKDFPFFKLQGGLM